jgi:hypothetical protein
VRLVDFLITLLEAQAQTLQRLAALFGEDLLMEMLENAPEYEEKPEVHAKGFIPSPDTSANYAELEGAVREFSLPAVLQFHLWAYPHYRAFIESELELSDRVDPKNPEAVVGLADEAIRQAEVWLKNLPIAPEFFKQAHSAAQLPWIKFRAQLLKKAGQRPLGAV